MVKGKAHDRPDDMLWEYLEPIRPYLKDDTLTEIAINRPGEIWTEGREGWQRYVEPRITLRHCMSLATLIGTFNDKKVNKDHPIMSGTLPKGERTQVIMPPACEPDTVSITIRKPSLAEKTLDDMEREGAFLDIEDGKAQTLVEGELQRLKNDGAIKEFLVACVRHNRNILVVGKTGSGKTTVTRGLIQHIPESERLITIEDVQELKLPRHPNKVHLFYARDEEGGARVSARNALAACLRMKPDRILLAELRGEEAWEYIKSVNTGHPGSITTMHANGAYEAFEQLASLIKDTKTGAHLDMEYIKRRLFTTIDVVLYYHQRRLKEIYYEPDHKRKLMG